jgi:WhiB family transcriptional regulator, redox-sensing transcriptional regulator
LTTASAACTVAAMDTKIIERLKPTADFYAWQDHGLCKDEDTEIFFLEHGQRGHEKAARESRALSVCGACPVRTACLEHALTVPEQYGVWGGMTVEQRQALVGNRWDS